jgi:methionine-gamma-lyase
MDILTTLIHADDDRRWDSSVAPSIAQGTTWAAESGEEFRALATEPLHPLMYNRQGNPNLAQAAAIVAALEGAEAALPMAAGMGAVTTTVLSLLSAGQHVVGQRSMYAGVSGLMLELLPRFGVGCTQVDQGDSAAFEAALRPATALVLLETPSNPLLEITDLASVCALARGCGALTIVDNTFATPINQRPLEFGADLVWHSATKYMGGHADLMAGVVAGRYELIEQIWHTLQMTGAVLAPFNAWLLVRGLRTLSLRMERHNRNGLALAEALAAHPAVTRVYYPGLPDHRGHEIAARQMEGFGGVLSFELEGGYETADAFIGELQLAKRAASLGGVHSLAVHPAALWAESLTPEQLAATGVSPGLVRFATGIEHHEDLVADVSEALEKIASPERVP